MTASQSLKQRPRLKNLDELLQLNDGINPLEQGSSSVGNTVQSKRAVVLVSINEPVPFPGHPFRLYEGERLEDMVESIRTNGVLVPVILSEMDNQLVMLSGHNRINAAKIAGLETVPAIVLKGVSGAEAWVYVVETNLMQRSFSDMAHTEKAAVIATQHSKLFSQGKRNDIIRALHLLENAKASDDTITLAQVEQRCHSREIVAHEYGLSKDTVARYLRINQLVPLLKKRLDNGDFGLVPAVTLSFLNEDEQRLVDSCIEQNTFKVDMKKADTLRQYSESGGLDGNAVYLVLSGKAEQKAPPNRTPTVKVKKNVYARFFLPNQTAKEVEEIVEKALELYFSRN